MLTLGAKEYWKLHTCRFLVLRVDTVMGFVLRSNSFKPRLQQPMKLLMHSVCLSFRLRFSLSLNSRMAIRWQNSHQIIIWPFWKSQSKWLNGNSATVLLFGHCTDFNQIWWVVIQWLFCSDSNPNANGNWGISKTQKNLDFPGIKQLLLWIIKATLLSEP